MYTYVHTFPLTSIYSLVFLFYTECYFTTSSTTTFVPLALLSHTHEGGCNNDMYRECAIAFHLVQCFILSLLLSLGVTRNFIYRYISAYVILAVTLHGKMYLKDSYTCIYTDLLLDTCKFGVGCRVVASRQKNWKVLWLVVWSSSSLVLLDSQCVGMDYYTHIERTHIRNEMRLEIMSITHNYLSQINHHKNSWTQGHT